MQTAATTTKPSSRGWTDARRARQAMRIRAWAPWARSTGPKTTAGKAKSAKNSYKHGGRSLALRIVNQALKAQRAYLRLLKLKKRNLPNELLTRIDGQLNKYDRIFRYKLYQWLHYSKNDDDVPKTV